MNLNGMQEKNEKVKKARAKLNRIKNMSIEPSGSLVILDDFVLKNNIKETNYTKIKEFSKNVDLSCYDEDVEKWKYIELPCLEKIGGNAKFRNVPFKELRKLKSVGGNLSFYKGSDVKLSSLETLDNELTIEDSSVSAPKLKYVGDLYVCGQKINLNALEHVSLDVQCLSKHCNY